MISGSVIPCPKVLEYQSCISISSAKVTYVLLYGGWQPRTGSLTSEIDRRLPLVLVYECVQRAPPDSTRTFERQAQ